MSATFQYPSGPVPGRRKKEMFLHLYQIRKSGKMKIRVKEKDLRKKRYPNNMVQRSRV